MTEKQLFYPLLSVYFSLILGDLQKEKLQIVSIFRFGHKKRGLFQCPPKGKEFYPNAFARGGLVNCSFCERVKYQLRVTPTANRNSYRVAMIGGVDTQGSVLRPQPWAGESQLLQSCRCLWQSRTRVLSQLSPR